MAGGRRPIPKGSTPKPGDPEEAMMEAIMARLRLPAKESHVGIALCLSMVMMTLMLGVILWQADLIGYQRDLIRWLYSNGRG